MPGRVSRHGEECPGEAGARLEPRTAPMQRNSCPALRRNPPLPAKDDRLRSAEPVL